MERVIAKKVRPGFSLLELVAVVTLIGIVAAVTMYRLANLDKSTAGKNVVVHDARVIQLAIERYRNELGEYPTNVTTLETIGYIKMPNMQKITDLGFVLEYDLANGLMKVRDTKSNSYVYP